MQNGELTQRHKWQHGAATPDASGNAVLHSVFSADGKYVATGGVDNTAYLWSVDRKAVKAISPALKHTSDIVHLAISPDCEYLATSSIADMNTCVWAIATFVQSPARYPQNLRVHIVRGVNRAVFSHDSQWLATASNDKLAKVWSLSRGELAAQFRHAGNVRGIIFTDDNSRLATVSDSSLTDRLSQLPKESWPKLYMWNLRPQDPRELRKHINETASLLVASQLNTKESTLRMFASTEDQGQTGPEFADQTYEEFVISIDPKRAAQQSK